MESSPVSPVPIRMVSEASKERGASLREPARRIAVPPGIEVLAKEVVDAALEVHRFLGPGLLESVYEQCLAAELSLRNIPFERQL